MASSIPSLGSSALDVGAIVSSLVANKRAATDKQIAATRALVTTQVSAIGSFTSALASVGDALNGLRSGKAFHTLKVSSSDLAVASAVADERAQPNAYRLVVHQLARSQKVTSPPVDRADGVLGGGALSLRLGDSTMTIALDARVDTLETVRDRINDGAGNPGVSAAIVTGTDGAHLVLASKTTGLAGAFSVSVSGNAALAGYAFDPAKDVPTSAAQDATFSIDGLEASSSGNTVSGVIDGVTLTLGKTGQADVALGNDPAAVTTTVQGLVSAYNQFVATYRQLTRFDAAHGQVGPLLGDATVSTIKARLASLLGSASHGGGHGPGSLSDLGISVQLDGTLKLDATKLHEEVTTVPEASEHVLGTSPAIASMASSIADWTGSEGILTARLDNLNTHSHDLDVQSARLDARMALYAQQLTRQYTKLDATMTRLQSTSAFLAQQFEALNKK